MISHKGIKQNSPVWFRICLFQLFQIIRGKSTSEVNSEKLCNLFQLFLVPMLVFVLNSYVKL